jgi:hypothetical protein
VVDSTIRRSAQRFSDSALTREVSGRWTRYTPAIESTATLFSRARPARERSTGSGQQKEILERLRSLPDDGGPEAIRSEFAEGVA